MKFTAKKTIKMAMVGGAIAATALLSACSGNGVAGNGSPVRNAAETAATGGQGADSGGQGAAAGGTGGTTSNGDVNCSKNGGQVGAPGRQKMDLIAVAATDGTTPGCTEAFNVIAEYYKKLPQAEGPGERVLDVQGRWTCARQADDAGSKGAVVCGVPNDSLQLETRPAGGTGKAPSPQARKFPNSTQAVQFTGYDAGARMVRFQLTGHGEGEQTYRLPLQKGGKVFSAATVCPSDSVTIDDQGLGNRPCGQDQLLQQLKDGNPVLAQITVNGDDQISVVKEIYRP
ncbi:hypothetical protein [Amycolatopsis alba]|uniref:Uncharacterized protein n=1 Tax=Amycolatopsis alba DSM 44262 TaxID=1125972 RepID=A0A229R7A7_AMYAL|nr:hypothetical protein [Amycolatopsis alba]OXM42485.1 hypothetical protein CFP75_42505 [Amycolatopsis alba DSM 44262]